MIKGWRNRVITERRERGSAMTQKFHMGDLVHVAKDLGPSMSHFTNDIDAIVLGSYADQYGYGDNNSYSLHLKGRGHCSWYYADQLTLIEKSRSDILEEWKRDEAIDDAQKSDLDWIFSNGPEIIKAQKATGQTVLALTKCLGITADQMWGKNGEGATWYSNAMRVLALAEPFLLAKDKMGWLEICEQRRKA